MLQKYAFRIISKSPNPQWVKSYVDNIRNLQVKIKMNKSDV